MTFIELFSWKAKVEQWMESSEPTLKATFFHAFDNSLQSGYVGILASGKEEPPIDTLAKKTAPAIKKALIMVFILLIVGLFAPIPQSSMDSTIWVGVLSFEGASALGYMAIIPWLVKVNMRAFVTILTVGIRSNLLSFSSEQEKMTIDTFESKVESEMNERFVTQVMARSMLRGGISLFAVIFIMCLGIWLTPRWKAAVLCVSIYWVADLLQGLLLPAALVYSDLLLSLYNFLKVEHEGIKKRCRICQTRTSQSVKITVKNSGSGIGKWFFRIIWLVIWATCIRTRGLSEFWTWILLFVPVYVPALLYIFKILRRSLIEHRLFRGHRRSDI